MRMKLQLDLFEKDCICLSWLETSGLYTLRCGGYISNPKREATTFNDGIPGDQRQFRIGILLQSSDLQIDRQL